MIDSAQNLEIAKNSPSNSLLRCSAARIWVFFCLIFFMQSTLAQAVTDSSDDFAKQVSAIIAAKNHPYLKQPNILHRTEDLDSLYKLFNYKLIWLGTPNAANNIKEVLNLFATASGNGLNPDNYDVIPLQQKSQLALKPESNDAKSLALYDTALSISLLRFLHDLHYGRVDPQGIQFNLKLREKKLIDLPVLIQENLQKDTLAQMPSLVEPQLKQYQKLKTWLATYRRLAEQPNNIKLNIEKPVYPGQLLFQIDELRKFLLLLGDLPEEKSEVVVKQSNYYKGKIVEAVKKFQHRHGLQNDGVLGKDTVEAINLPITQRVTQIELAMERLRWLPEANSGRSIIVNIPAFQLWAFNDVSEDSDDAMTMRVVVGKALENQTPVLMAEMSFIDFMPYWNVPDSIVKDEIMPKWIQNHNYLAKEKMELVYNFGNKVKPVAFSESSIEQVKEGVLKIRQRPGKKNPLGQVKFIFPNKDEVYLHGTPANSLFRKSRRDFSHGCVRVEKPELLAEFALNSQGKWTKDYIREAMKSTKTERVILKKSIPVLFFYITSFVDQQDNLVFYPDIYGHDAVLMEALQKKEDLSDNSIFVSSQPPLEAKVTK
jgi:L,D-transpeptidase YcbB